LTIAEARHEEGTMSDLVAQLRHAARALLARRSFALAAILTLAIGIGMTTSIFSVLYGVVLRPLSFRNADRLITLCERFPGGSEDWCGISPPNVSDIAERSRSIDTSSFRSTRRSISSIIYL